jgi:hypothetical protein
LGFAIGRYALNPEEEGRTFMSKFCFCNYRVGGKGLDETTFGKRY